MPSTYAGTSWPRPGSWSPGRPAPGSWPPSSCAATTQAHGLRPRRGRGPVRRAGAPDLAAQGHLGALHARAGLSDPRRRCCSRSTGSVAPRSTSCWSCATSTSQVYAGAQAALETGATTRPATYAGRVLDPGERAPAGRGLPGRARPARHRAPLDPRRSAGPRARDRRVRSGGDLAAPDGPGRRRGGPARDVGSDQLGPAQLGLLREVAVALDDQLDARGGVRRCATA